MPSAEIFSFKPRGELSAEESLQLFTSMCASECTSFGVDLNFEDDVWVVTDALDLKGKKHEHRLVFSNFESSRTITPVPMDEPFRSFAKCYLLYQQGMRPTKAVAGRLAALRALEAALVAGGLGANPVKCRPDILNRAANLIKERYSAAVAYRYASQLELIGEFLSTKGLAATGFDWKNFLPRPREEGRVGKAFDIKRQEKMPSPAALHALAAVFMQATEASDVLVCSAAAIMCAAPDRVNEVLGLRLDCEVTEKISSTGEDAYGLRWWSSKGAAPSVKWVVTSMADVVRKALRNLLRVTEYARIIARWYEANPNLIYLPSHLEHLRSEEWISLTDVADIVFADGASKQSAATWCITHGVGRKRLNGNKEAQALFADIEKVVIGMLPAGFPVADRERGLKYSSAIFVVRRNELHAQRGTYRCAIELVEQGDLYSRLGSRDETGIDSIFRKFGFSEDDGSYIRITSHQFRHYLNTLAQAGGLSQLDIAKWSGRVNVHQNAAYDHVSDRDVLAKVRETVGETNVAFGPETKSYKPALIARNEFGSLMLQTAHTTEFGFCVHDFSMLPCQIHMDCMNCEEHACVKGQDAAKETSLRIHCEETRTLIRLATDAQLEGDFGADRWLQHQRLTLARLEQLCQILDDEHVPAGSIVRLSGLNSPSRIEIAMQRRMAADELPNSLLTLRQDVVGK
jgi:hypothetical protein